MDTFDQENLVDYPEDIETFEMDHTGFQEAIQRLLRLNIGIIPMKILNTRVDMDAASLLIENDLLVYHKNLFVESNDWESDGFFKEMSENLNFDLSARLARFGVSWQMWKATAVLPEKWKSRLSAMGMQMLRLIPMYYDQLPSESTSHGEGNTSIYSVLSKYPVHELSIVNETMKDSDIPSVASQISRPVFSNTPKSNECIH